MYNAFMNNKYEEQKISFDKIGIVYNSFSTGYEKAVENIKAELAKADIPFVVNHIDNMDNTVTLAIILGGDGTLLKAARYYAAYSIPVFGINMGRLGFLSQSSIDEISSSVQKILNEQYHCEERLMLYATPGKLSALNDIVIKSESFSRTARLFVSINGNNVCDYLADGLIISTPTGSTAYNISAGGPILVPRLNAFIIVPICPHSLNARPLVIPSNEKIEITSADNLKRLKIAADGQNLFSIPENTPITIRKHKRKAKILLLNDKSFYSVLKEKLYWGMTNSKK